MLHSCSYPKKFFPLREDVLNDDTLSAEEKRTLLDHWKVQLEGRGGADPGDQTVDDKGDKAHDADGEAQGKVDGEKGG